MEETFLIVGLGNPGRRYEKTRHNVGFMVIDRLAAELGFQLKKGRGSYESGAGRWNDLSLVAAKPMTYMNNSGIAVAELFHYHRIELQRLLIISDDTELPFGRLRLRRKGSSGGHRGLESVIQHLKTNEFARLRIGIGAEFAKRDMADFVLSRFSKNEQEELEPILQKAVEAVLTFMRDGIDRAMNLYN